MQAVALRVLGDRVKARSDDVKAQLAASLDPGDRKVAALDDATKVGVVSFANGRTSARVTDERALLRWVRDNRPDEIVDMIRGSFLSWLLEDARKRGAAVDANGEVIPGVTVTASEPYVSVKPLPEGIPALVDAIRAGQLLALDEAVPDAD